MRLLTGGESHGSCVTAILEGFPAGVRLSPAFIREELVRRNSGTGRGARMALETEEISITGGIRNGLTTGAPLVFSIPNSENALLSEEQVAALQKDAFLPRPGHADLPGVLKYGFGEARNVIERASARETAARVAAGAAAKTLLGMFGISFASCVVQVGGVAAASRPTFEKASRLDRRFPFLDQKKKGEAAALIEKCRKEGETLGGRVWLSVRGLVPGIGSYAQWDERLDAKLAWHLMSIPSVKGVLIGDIMETCSLPGSRAQDRIAPGADPFFSRKTNKAGGIEGGLSNGEDVEAYLLVKPLPSSKKAGGGIDLRTLRPSPPEVPRSDTTSVVPVAVVAEASAALAISGTYLEKFGRDSAGDALEAFAKYKKRIGM